MWLLDCESLASLLGILKIEPAEDPFHQIDGLNLGSNTTELSLPQFEDSKSTEETGLELLLDIPLEVTVELGRVRMLIKEVVDLGPGSIVELDAVVGDPVDVMVNGRLVARGEVVVLGDNFGVRVSEIMSPTARLQRIGERE
jgi:flagellar motor switch protein FliN/FliY